MTLKFTYDEEAQEFSVQNENGEPIEFANSYIDISNQNIQELEIGDGIQASHAENTVTLESTNNFYGIVGDEPYIPNPLQETTYIINSNSDTTFHLKEGTKLEFIVEENEHNISIESKQYKIEIVGDGEYENVEMVGTGNCYAVFDDGRWKLYPSNMWEGLAED